MRLITCLLKLKNWRNCRGVGLLHEMAIKMKGENRVIKGI